MQDILICKPSRETDGAADVVVVGAGLTGLCIARALHAVGVRVRVLDKGRGVGGRLATRRFDGGVFDHGLQRVDLADQSVRSLLDAALPEGLAGQAGLRHTPEGLIGMNGITAIAKALATGLDVALAARVDAVAATASGWQLRGDGLQLEAPVVVLTAPVPQVLALVAAGRLTLDPAVQTALAGVRYHRCVVAMATLDSERVDEHPNDPARNDYFIEPASRVVARIVLNHHKGISPVAAATLHASADWSEAHWDLPGETRTAQLLAAAQPWLPGVPRVAQGHGWRYARYAGGWKGDACVALDAAGTLLVAGDALGGGDVSGALQSAAAVVARLGVASGR